MYRDIIITTSGGLNFTQTENNIVQDDVQSYRIVYKLSEAIEGYIKVTAKIPNQEPIFGIAPINGDTAYFIIPNSMYAIEGEVSLRVSIVTADERIITTKEITLKVIEANGDGNIAGDDRVPVLDTLISEVVDLKNQVTIALSEMTDVSGDIQLHMANEDNPHSTSYTNIQGENPGYLKAETDTLLDLKVDKATGKSLVPDTEISKLATVSENANNYVLPSDVVQDSNYVHTDNNFTTALKNKVENDDGVDSQGIVDEGEDNQPISFSLQQNKTVYKVKFYDGSGFYLDMLSSQLDLIDKNYRLELIAEIVSMSETIPSCNIKFCNSEGVVSPTWIIPPVIEHPHTINKFAFETFDGGVTWYGNQCYSFEVV